MSDPNLHSKDSGEFKNTKNNSTQDDTSSFTESIQSYEDEHNQNQPIQALNQDLETQPIESQLSRHITHILSETTGVQKIESLARVLSTKTKKELTSLEIRDGIDFDLQQLLNYIRNHQLEQGIVPNDAGVAFKDLNVVGVDASAAVAPSIDNMLMDFFTWPKRFIKNRGHKPTRFLVKDAIGVVESGEMLMIIGRPGAGASSTMRAIAGEISEFVEVTGEFSYDGLDQHEMMKRFKGYVIYVPELDFHFPRITVKETLDFALKCKTPRLRIDDISKREYVDSMRDLWCTVFGLTHTYKTIVGSGVVRGVSGGERKRVSLVEALAMSASIYCWDNATLGLDASSALEFAQAIRTATNLTNTTAIVCVYQAGQKIYDLMDKVSVLYNGQQIYFGPAEDAIEYFTNMGFVKPHRMTSAEFLTSVTLDWDNKNLDCKEGYESTIPKNVDEFIAYWKASPQYEYALKMYDEYVANHNSTETYERLEESMKQRKQKNEPLHSLYTTNYWTQIWYCMVRGVHRVKGDMTYTQVYLSSFLTKGFFVGSMFYRIDPINQSTTSGAYSRGGLIFYVLLFCSLTSLAEISSSFANRAIIMKHKSYSMYHTSAEALQEIFTEMPVKFIAVLILALVSYWLPALKWEAGAFFQYFLYMFTVQQCTSFIFKFCATITKDGTTAHAVGGLYVLVLALYCGFFLPIGQMHHWARWIRYINPLTYAYESTMATEFHGRNMLCSKLIPSGVGYESVSLANQVCNFAGSVKGSKYVNGDTYLKAAYHSRYKPDAWQGWGVNVIWTFFYIILNVIMSEYLKPLEGGGDLLLFKRGFMPEFGDNADSKVATREEMMFALNGPNVDLDEVIANKDIFSWKNLNVDVNYDGGSRRLLQNVYGYVKPGKMTALMGSSGAGKTVLLTALSQRIKNVTITGDLLVNNKPLPSSFKRSCGFVTQADNHMTELTVKESLQFAAELRQNASISHAEKMEYADKIIKLLGMQNYENAVVGKIGRGLNVEQRKKLSIGVELVAKPSLLLFLDEPTSGLDSNSSWNIVQFLKALADSGMSILCTIHQPSATLFEEFDRLLLLKRGGEMVYFGDIGKNSRTMLSYLERESGLHCAKSENPAEWMLDVVVGNSVGKDWAETWRNSPEHAQAIKELDALNESLTNKAQSEDPELLTVYAAPHWIQFKTVLWRTYIQFWRAPVYIRAKFLECVFCALVVGLSYVWTGRSTAAQAANQSFSSTFMMLLIALAMVNQMHVFAIDSRELYEVREGDSSTFHWAHLLLSHSFIEILWSSLCVFFCFICYYWPLMGSGRASHAGYWFFIYVIQFPIYFISYGSWIIYMAPDVPSASMINSNIFAMMMLFCGILQPEDKMPGFWTFMYKFSPFTYVVQALTTSVVHGKKVECIPHELRILDPPSGQTCGSFLNTYTKHHPGYIKNPDATSNCEYCPYNNQDQVVAEFGVHWDQRWRNFGFIWAYIIFNFVAMLGCYYIMRVKGIHIPDIKGIKKWFSTPRKERHEPEKNIFAEKPEDKNIVQGTA
ncbi:ATP-binding cassette multidrug transporter [Hanseniaspora uvarum]|nr:ATP-binding cassette multidrug transporter [Hanseniaspora uvarum]